MSTTTPHPESRRTAMGRMAFGTGAAIRRAVQVVTFPYRALSKLLGRRGTKRAGRSAAVLRRERLDLADARRRVVPRPDGAMHFEAAHIAADEGLSALSETLSDPDPSVRMLALDVVCELSGERAARLLTGVLHDPEPSVRCAAARSAAQLGATGTVFSLILALDDPSRDVREAAARAIEDMTGRHVALETDPDAARRTVDELKAWWKERRFAELAAARRLGPSP